MELQNQHEITLSLGKYDGFRKICRVWKGEKLFFSENWFSGVSEEKIVFTFLTKIVRVPARVGTLTRVGTESSRQKSEKIQSPRARWDFEMFCQKGEKLFFFWKHDF